MQRTIDAVDEMWANATQAQRVELLQVLGFNTSWAEADTVSEMPRRGGGWVARDLIALYERRFK